MNSFFQAYFTADGIRAIRGKKSVIICEMPVQLRSTTPALSVAGAFVLTVIVARLFSYRFPRIHWEPIAGVHIHHYVYGIFILTAAGYLALVFKGPRASWWITLLYGLGVGLTFDEFGMWLNPPLARGVRWNSDGLTIVIAAVIVGGLIPFLLRQRVRAPKPEMTTPAELNTPTTQTDVLRCARQ